jgi:hypothetical protein
MLKSIAISLALTVAVTAPLSAQGKGTKAGKIPPGQRPPAGMCRIWLDGVAPGQQPAPTDCATAVRNRPANGRVIFGDDYVDGKGKNARGGDDERRTAPRDDRDDERVVRDARTEQERRDARNTRPRRDADSVTRADRKAKPRTGEPVNRDRRRVRDTVQAAGKP